MNLRLRTLLHLTILAAAFNGTVVCQDNATAIIQRSMKANLRDWDAAPGFNRCERSESKDGTKTYAVSMLFGSPYERLVAVNGKPLNADEEAREKQKLKDEIAKRRAETADERHQRVSEYESNRDRDHLFMQELPKAFDFKEAGRQHLNDHDVYLLLATPRKGYEPPSAKTKALRGMRGKLWIDTKTYQWVKVEAEVKHAVSIHGFLAKVEPGTRFELEKVPVSGQIWLPRRFSMKAHARVLFLFSHHESERDTYFDYQPAKGNLPLTSCPE